MRVFVEHYLQCWNATAAARLAGYNGNDVTLRSIGYQNLQNPNVAKLISERIAEVAMGADEVLIRLAAIARGTLKHFVIEDDNDVWPALTTDEAKANFHLLKKIKPKRRVGGISGMEYTETEVELEIHDPVRALELIGKHHKLFTEKLEHSGENGGPIQVDAPALEQATKELQEWRKLMNEQLLSQKPPPT